MSPRAIILDGLTMAIIVLLMWLFMVVTPSDLPILTRRMADLVGAP